MKIKLYHIDAFTTRPFEGNPAGVCPLETWLPDAVMQSIAAENNLSETAFYVPEGDGFRIRWFTPKSEIALCGHATLAAAYVLFNILGYENRHISFFSRSGTLGVEREGGELLLDFPAEPPTPCNMPPDLIAAFNGAPIDCLCASDYIALFEDEQAIKLADPDIKLLRRLDRRGVIITAPSQRYDFVARYFAPNFGIDEDPVTGSAYTELAPYWASRLGPKRFRVRQLSARGGELSCWLSGDRVIISGSAVAYMEGAIDLAIDANRGQSIE